MTMSPVQAMTKTPGPEGSGPFGFYEVSSGDAGAMDGPVFHGESASISLQRRETENQLARGWACS